MAIALAILAPTSSRTGIGAAHISHCSLRSLLTCVLPSSLLDKYTWSRLYSRMPKRDLLFLNASEEELKLLCRSPSVLRSHKVLLLIEKITWRVE